MSFSRGVFWICLGFLSGVFLASFFNPGFYFYFIFFLGGLIFISVFYKRSLSFGGIIIFGFLFGIFWEEKFEGEIVPRCDEKRCDIHFFNEKGEIAFEGSIIEEPEEKQKSLQIKLEARNLVAKDKEKALRGKVLLVLGPGSDLKYGQVLRVKGRLQTPKSLAQDFNWPEYLRKERVYSTMFEPETEVISQEEGNKFKAKLLVLKSKLKEKARSLSPPEGAILSAMTLGDKSRISEDLKAKLSRSGLAHIVAISGLHIMILFEIFLSLFLIFGLWRKEATFLTLFFIALYILMIGAPASALRAGIMGGLLYLAKALGRLNQSSQAIVFAASAMLFQNPLILARDVGFQLSFLAILGIIYLAPVLKSYLKNDSQIKSLLAITFSAQVFTLPLVVFNFGNLPFLALISNILVLPLLPFLLGASFFYLLLSLAFSWLSLPLSFFLEVPYLYLIKVIEIAARASLSSVTLNLHPAFLLFSYFILGIILIKISKKRKERRG